MSKLQIPVLILMLGLLPACSSDRNGPGYSSAFQHLSIDSHGNVVAYARHGGSEASVTPAGDLSIAGKPVAVTPAQRQLLKNYRDAALKLRDDGVATGKAGVSTGLHAIGAVVSGLASGKPDSIDAKVNASAGKVEALAQGVCKDLAQLFADQGAVIAALPAFGPYATIEPHEVTECHTGSHPPQTVVIYGGPSFDHGRLVLTASGRPSANVNAAGNLHMGGKAIATSSPQRDLLKNYYAQADVTQKDLGAVNKTASAYGEHVANDVLAGLLGPDASEKGGGHADIRGELATSTSRLCQDLLQLKATQQKVRSSLPALEPYAAFHGTVECGTTTGGP